MISSTRNILKIAGFATLASILAVCPRAVPAEDGHEGHDHSAHAEEGHVDEVAITPEAMKLFGIALETTVLQPLTEVASLPARVAYNAEAMAHVGAPLDGRATEIRARLGDQVAKGDLLAVIESPELGEAESDFLQKGSVAEAAKNAVEIARIAFERAEELRRTNSVSVTDFLSRQGELKKAEGELKVAEAARTAAENRLHILGLSQERVATLLATGEVTSRYELRAPIEGRIVQREVTPGEIVGPDKDLLFVMADMRTLWVLADAPERIATRIGSDARGRIVLGFDSAASIDGTVAYISPETNPRTRTAQVRLVVDSARAATTSAPAPVAGNVEEHDHDDHAGHDHEGHDHEEHAQPAAAAQLTQAEIDQFRAKGDWCGEHGVPESQCALCNPGLASAAVPQAPIRTAGQLLMPGMFAQVELELASIDGTPLAPVLSVPEQAIQTFEGRQVVFVPADEANTFKPAPIVAGRRVGSRVPVLSGLKAGDRYVATGSFILKAEMGKSGAAHEH